MIPARRLEIPITILILLVVAVMVDGIGKLPNSTVITKGKVVVHSVGETCGGDRVAVLPAGYRLPVRRVGYGKGCVFYEVRLPGGGKGFVYGDSQITVERLAALRHNN